MDFISLPNALKEMETLVGGQPPKFNIIACTYDQERGTGGQLLELNNVKLSHLKGEVKNAIPVEHLRPSNFAPKETKNPHHKENRTKNFLLPNGQIRKVHIHFILFYNGKQIIQ